MKFQPVSAMALLAVLAPAVAFAAPAATRRTWQLGSFSWIKRGTAEKGAAPNGHPLRVDASVLVQALGSVRFVAGPRESPLFDPAEAASLGNALAEALSVAGPDEDLQLLSTSKRDLGLLADSLGVTARVFCRDGNLNLIVHDTRLDFMRVYFMDFRMPDFQYGSRAQAGGAVLHAAGAEARRPDWLVLPLGTALRAAEAPIAAPPVAQPPAPAPAAITAPTPAAAPPPVASTASLEDRLRALKRLRDQGLISEADYTRKKQELLKDY